MRKRNAFLSVIVLVILQIIPRLKKLMTMNAIVIITLIYIFDEVIYVLLLSL